MTIHEDETIIGALRTLADPDTAGAAPVNSLLRRGHQARTHKSRARGAAAGLGLAGLATALTAVAVTGSAGPPAGQPVSFALAANAMAETSFHFKITAEPSVAPAGDKS